jgi:O-antigen/teichoic acid export membrane protein
LGKAVGMAKVSAKGGLNLFLGVSLSTVISALGVIIVADLLGGDQYGLYTVVLIPSTLFGLFRDWGINSAMIKYIAQYRSEDKTNEMKNVLASGLIFELVLGILLSLISLFLAGFLTNVFHRPGAETMIAIASVSILASGLLVAPQSVFVGFESMGFYSFTLIFGSCLKVFLSILLIFLGYGVLGAVLGNVLSAIITSAFAIIFFYFFFYRKSHGSENGGLNLSRTLNSMLRYGLPLSVSNILSGILTQFQSFLMVIYCSNLLIGNYGMAVNFSLLISFFTTPITTVLFPAFSKLNSEKEMGTLRNVFQSSVKYATLLTVPVTFAIMVLSEPLVSTLFDGRFSYTPLFLTLLAVSYLYTGLGNLSLGNFLSGQGKTKVAMNLALISMGIGLPLNLVLIPEFGIVGLIVASLVSVIPYLVVGLWWVKRNFGVSVDWASSTKIFLASAIPAAITYVVLSQLTFHPWVKLLVGGIIFLVVCFVVAPLIRAIDENDVNNLREIVSALGPISYLFNLALNIIEWLLNIFTF